MAVPLMDRVLGDRPEYPDHTVESVDLGRFSGKWYEIAAIPNRSESGCSCNAVEYTFKDDHLEIRDACSKEGRFSVRTARAFPVPGTNNSQFKVQFMWPFKTDYWIIYVDENYQHAMVGDPRKRYLWILSRAPHMDEETYHSLLEHALEKGYAVHKVRRIEQSCAA